MKRLLAFLSAILLSAGIIVGVQTSPAGAYSYVGGFAINGSKYISCFVDLPSGWGPLVNQHTWCNVYSYPSGTLLWTALDIYQNHQICDTLSVVQGYGSNPSKLIIRNAGHPDPGWLENSGDNNPPGCGPGTSGSGTAGQIFVSVNSGTQQSYVSNIYGGLFQNGFTQHLVCGVYASCIWGYGYHSEYRYPGWDGT